MRRVPGVVSVGRSGIGVATANSNNTGVQVPGRREPVNIGTYSVDPEFFETMGIELVAGRLFDENRPADRIELPFPPTPEAQRALVARGANIVINELAARRMGFRDPAEAVGKIVQVGFVEPEYGGVVPTRIIGVVRDLRFRSIREPIDPIMFSWDTNGAGALLIRYDGTDPQGVRSRVEQAWRRIAPDVPFDGEFSEDKVAELYEAEEARAKVFAGFAVPRGDRRLPRPVRPRRLHRRAADQGDRHQEGARRAHPRHRPAARLAILQAGDHRQSDRLAGRLVGDARMAEHVRRAHRPWACALRARRPARAWRSRSAPSPATPSRSPAPIRSWR